MRRLFLATATLFVALGLAARFWLWRPMGEGPAGPSLAREGWDHRWTDRPVLVVGLGDSVTTGFGASPGMSYFERLSRSPATDSADMRGLDLAQVIPRLRTTNLAMSGCTTRQALKAQLPKLGRHPDSIFGIVTITLGGNDLIHNYGSSPPVEDAMYGATWEQAQPWIGRFGERLDRLLADIESAFPGGCWIFIGSIYDPSDGTGSLLTVGLPPWRDGLRIHAEYNRTLKKTASRHPTCTVVDIHGAFLGHGITCRQFWRPTYRSDDPTWWYHSNVEDPNDRGYDAILRLFLAAISDRAKTKGWRID